MPQQVSYLGSSGDARESSSQEYTNWPSPGLLVLRKQSKTPPWPPLLPACVCVCVGGFSLLDSHLRRRLRGIPQTLALFFLHLVLVLTPPPGGGVLVE